ncbi:MAG: class I SAM-dependent methyltransferase [Methylacidiphilales bacterium]|nr:class I SAM-dependent methyltransferase [Candidatus Methylacidiphilales bacterium]
MVLYNKIGKNYAQTRRSDPRIVTQLIEILSFSHSSIIADIGAGTGSYSLALVENGYQVIAVEPSNQMRNQAIPHPKIDWIEGYAEKLPLPDDSVDTAIMMLALHHFQNYQQGLCEAYRVTAGKQIILFTCDPAIISEFWLTKYFPSFIQDIKSTFLPISELTAEIQTITNNPVDIIPFPLPNDLSDSFAAVGWRRPELYLNHQIRNGISSFAKLNLDEINLGLSRLQEDLDTGVWDREYGQLRQQNQYDVGYRFIHSTK